MGKIKNILLIDPPGLLEGFNSGLAYLSSSLQRNKHTVEVLDLNNNKKNIYKRLKKKSINKDVIGISIKSFSKDISSKLIKKIKEYNPNAKIIVGGTHITLDGENFLKENYNVDIGIIGDGEIIINEILSRKNIKNIKNIIYRKSNKIITNKINKNLTSLDNLPFPDYSKFDTYNKIKNYNLITSRGCPYSCTYCSVPLIYNKKWRARSVKNIIKELKKIKNKYEHFSIIDDNFTLDIKRAKEFCKEYIKSGMSMTWSCPNGIRADRIDEELIYLMKKSKCNKIAIGIESLNEKVFLSIKKGEKTKHIINAINLIKKYNINLTGFIIIGLPSSNYKIDKETVLKIRKLKINALANLLVPFPKTEVRDIILKNKKYKIINKWEKSAQLSNKPKVIFTSLNYNKNELEKMYYFANLRLENYYLFVQNQKSILKKIIILLKLILKYDLNYLPIHIFKIIIKK